MLHDGVPLPDHQGTRGQAVKPGKACKWCHILGVVYGVSLAYDRGPRWLSLLLMIASLLAAVWIISAQYDQP